ncbi:MAG TPA: coenzyme F420-0:L-glutamate ligase [Candidatus Bathyarchaeia archaeon]|nr:coenzyme F420-0:L-glutamate ligase [Candidatus Bathyarchaeia archaeon]
MLEIFPLKGFPIIKEEDNITEMILNTLEKNTKSIEENDIIVIAQSIISRVEKRIINLNDIEPSSFAKEIAEQSNKDPKLVEMILRESKNICKNRNGVLITETKHGFVCANSGIDKSNVPGENTVSLLPINPDKSAQKIRKDIKKRTKKDVAVIISDTHNRPFRMGAINIAIGCSGINPLKNYIEKIDLFGYKLKSSVTSDADQLCSAAGLVMGEANEGFPVIIIRGYQYEKGEISAKTLIRPEERDYFR